MTARRSSAASSKRLCCEALASGTTACCHSVVGRSPAPGVREALSGHTVIYLEISVGEGVRRTGGSTTRPLFAGVGPRREVPVADDRADPAVPAGRHTFG